ncbi:hypothetical protein Tco_0960943 [Tanacetum coccineum]
MFESILRGLKNARLVEVCTLQNCGCAIREFEDKILVSIPTSSTPLKFEKFCLDCGDPIHGLHCQGCALIQKTFRGSPSRNSKNFQGQLHCIHTVYHRGNPINSLSMGDKHLDTIPATESDEVIMSSVENLVPIPSESEVYSQPSNLFLEETNTFDNSIPESETFRFNLEEISSGSPTTHSELSLPDYKAFYVDNDHFKERSSGSTTTHAEFSKYDSFIFDLSINPFPPAGRSDFNHEEFANELTHIMSLPNLECFKFKIEPDPGDLTSIDLGIRKNASTTNVNVPLEDDQSSLFTYVVWIFLAFLTYPVVPPYLLSTRNEDTIFDPGISIYHSFMPDVSHRSETFNVYPNHLNESPMMILPCPGSLDVPHGPINLGTGQA